MDPLPLVVCGAAAALYALGRRGRTRVWREVSFYSGVALAFVVLERPFDDWADRWLSVHMTQHIVLMTVVAPLVVLGRPWPRMWLPFPLSARRAVGGALSRSPAFRRSAGFLKLPAVALAVQSAMIALWHVPQLYDAAVTQRVDSRPRAHLLRRAFARVLGRAARRAAGAGPHRPSPPLDLVRRGDVPELDPRHGPRLRHPADLRRVPVPDRPAARCGDHVGAGIAHVLRRGDRRVLPLARARRRRAPAAEPRPEELSWT